MMVEAQQPLDPHRSPGQEGSTGKLTADDEVYRSFAANIPGIAYRATLAHDAELILVEGDSMPICGMPIEHFRNGGLQALLDIVLKDDQPRLLEAMEQSARTGESTSLEYRVRHADGSIRWVSDFMRPIYDNSGAFLYHDGIVLDVTERRTAEQKLDAQRQLLENIIANIPVFVFWKDRDCRYLGCNQLVADIAGLDSPEGLVGKDDFDEVMPWTPEQALAFQRDDLDVMKSGQARINVEESQTQADGTTAHLLTSKVPLRGQNGEVTGMLGLSFDITERRRTEERLDLAIRAANEGLWDWNLITDEIFFNDTTFSMLGYQTGDIPSTLDGWKNLLHPDDLARALNETQRHLDGETPSYRCEIRAKAKDGSWRWLLDVGEVTERDEAGNPTRMMGVHIDITELRKAREAAEAADHAKSEFLSNMSHELRTPLNGVLGYAQILLRDPSLTSDQRDSMDAIRNCGQHLLTLINDVLDLSKIESGRLEIENAPVDLQRLLASVRDVVAQRATEKGISVQIEAAPEVPRGVRTDATKLRQVLVNLAGNAVKFTEQGAVTIRVAEPTLGRLSFEVRDTGVGMSDDELANVFDAFKQAAAGKAAGGTGLGLAISRRVVEAMGGELTATSARGEGSTFRVEIPLDECELIEQPSLAEDLDDSTIVRVPKGRVITILVTDDRSENREILRKLITSTGANVLLANDGQQALDVLAQHDVDLVLMDVRMPVMNGLEATQRIREDPALKELPVIAVSASVFENQRERIRDAGCDDFLAKPLKASELYQVLARYLNLPLESTAQQTPAASNNAAFDPARGAALARRIEDCLSVGDISSLGELAQELQAGSEAEQALGEQVRSMTRNFDLQGLKALASRLNMEAK